ncbi:hypothetical protein [Halococcus hamelinensis]|uniref:Uncharacterized protein n=1 Tax=Halococcus hamelinensis 100A6 TaxID=1132509 RepID=M0M1K2_9EURY|nr:hypothetical protein [Halococcus hamelinensis]EMA38469.1 hypothetical protein C447_09952 [Halococcus hamelinensis 100A6]
MTGTTYEWRSDTPRIRPDGERIGDGDPIDPTDHELRTWPDRVVAVESTDTERTDRSLTQTAIEAATDRKLQEMASQIDGVAEDQSAADLRAELYDHPDSEAVAAAVAAVEDLETDTGTENGE